MEDIKLKIENLRVFNNKKQTKENVQKLEEQNRIKVKQIQQNELKNSQRATEKYSKLSLRSPPELPFTEIDSLLAQRRFISFKHIQEMVTEETKLDKDWVTIAVLANKSEVKKTKTGTNFIIFGLSDLEGCEVKFLLFGDAYDNWWKEQNGTVLGVLNAVPMASENFPLSYKIEKAGKIIKIGVCADYGKCVGIDGINRCEGYVNL